MESCLQIKQTTRAMPLRAVQSPWYVPSLFIFCDCLADHKFPFQRLSADAPAELSAVVDELVVSLTTKFNAVSSEIFTKRQSTLEGEGFFWNIELTILYQQ